MKRLGLIAVVLAGIVGGVGSLWHARSNQERYCQANMRMLYSAAVSYCLEQSLAPDKTLSVQSLAAYLRPGGTVCPTRGARYPDFSVVNGPICPKGHRFLPGEPRPLRTASSNFKLAGLYRAYGYTNLIEHQAEP
jgi:hypothetical protein